MQLKEIMSRSVLKRIAAQKGESFPNLSNELTGRITPESEAIKNVELISMDPETADKIEGQHE